MMLRPVHKLFNIFILTSLLLLSATPGWTDEETLAFGRFGDLTIYRHTPLPKNIVLFVSGDGGWNLGVIDMARSLAALDALVVGIDITHYLEQLRQGQERCSYPAADLETLSKFIQKKLAYSRYRVPVLVGYSSGATLVYGALAQAPPGTFRGAISMGFCPDLPLNKPFCKGSGLDSKADSKVHGYIFQPFKDLSDPWIAFQGTADQVCLTTQVESFVKQVKNAEIILLPKVGHGFSVKKNWLPQFRDSFNRLISSASDNAPTSSSVNEQMGKLNGAISNLSGNPPVPVADLPLVEIQPQGQPDPGLFAVILSGDGGWASIDREVGSTLAAKGIPVVGLNTLQYFWTARTPDQAGETLASILRHYQQTWQRQRVLLVGYSLGADVLPAMAARLPAELKQQIVVLALIGPGTTASFEFHLSDWLGRGNDNPGLPIAPELAKLQDMNVLCLYGSEEKSSLCRQPVPKGVKFISRSLGGGHHFGGNYQQLTDMIIAETAKSP